MADFATLVEATGLKCGTYVGEFASPGLGRMIKTAGADFVFLDMEHSGFTFETAKSLLRNLHDAGLATVLRPPTQLPHHLAIACDIGAQGIVPPMLHTVEQAKSCIAAIKYPPKGRRGAAFAITHDDYSSTSVVESVARGNARTRFVGLIESEEGVRNCSAIAALDGVDCIWVGHLDLSISLGVPGDYGNPVFVKAIAAVMAAARSAGKPVGRMVMSPADGKRLYKEGCSFICYSGDLWLFRTALSDGLNAMRKAISEM